MFQYYRIRNIFFGLVALTVFVLIDVIGAPFFLFELSHYLPSNSEKGTVKIIEKIPTDCKSKDKSETCFDIVYISSNGVKGTITYDTFTTKPYVFPLSEFRHPNAGYETEVLINKKKPEDIFNPSRWWTLLFIFAMYFLCWLMFYLLFFKPFQVVLLERKLRRKGLQASASFYGDVIPVHISRGHFASHFKVQWTHPESGRVLITKSKVLTWKQRFKRPNQSEPVYVRYLPQNPEKAMILYKNEYW